MQQRRPVALGNRHADGVCRPPQTRQVLITHEDFFTVGADGFVDALTVEEAVIKDGNLRLFFFHEPIVQIDPHRYARWNELKNACALSSVSSSSLAGSEWATIPAPTCKYAVGPVRTSVRMTMFKSKSPFQPI